MIGKTASILWESKTEQIDNGLVNYFGYTPNFSRVMKTVTSTTNLSKQITEETFSGISETGEMLVA